MSNQILRICIAQLNITVGDLEGNTQKIISSIKDAENQKADIICFPELAITGYPPEDLLLRPKFIDDNISALDKITQNINNILTIVGFVDHPASKPYLYNAAALINNNEIVSVYHKACLPNYGVFDEKRYFTPGETLPLVNVKGVDVGVTICEDIWLTSGPLKKMSKMGAQLIININASPYHKRKSLIRQDILQKQAKKNKVFIVYNNLVGGQDELVFDGHSMIFDNKGDLIASLSQFKEELSYIDLQFEKKDQPFTIKLPPEKEIIEHKPVITPLLSEEEEAYCALKLGLRDYIHKNDFKSVLIGLSGGIDSALTSAIAVDALGAEKVTTVFMPSKYTSKESIEDATLLAKNLNIELLNIPIDNINQCYLSSLKHEFQNTEPGAAEENIQARIRGNILMSLSNKFGHIVLATGNKSELSVGYATLYGDMAGGFSVLKDVYKILVYKLANYRNSISKVIPERIITKPPSAELKPNQLDTDSLPPYDILDRILKAYIEEDKSPNEIIKEGFDKETVTRVVKMVDNNEYKRRQAAPGIKITPKAFGRDRRMPITNKYK